MTEHYDPASDLIRLSIDLSQASTHVVVTWTDTATSGELRLAASQAVAIGEAGARATTLLAERAAAEASCSRCHGVRKVPDWSDWHAGSRGPQLKSCPDCCGLGDAQTGERDGREQQGAESPESDPEGAYGGSEPQYFEMTREGFEEAARLSLERLGLTYAELEAMARDRGGNFTSAAAHSLWVAIGGGYGDEETP
jgi:hypothetical protein